MAALANIPLTSSENSFYPSPEREPELDESLLRAEPLGETEPQAGRSRADREVILGRLETIIAEGTPIVRSALSPAVDADIRAWAPGEWDGDPVALGVRYAVFQLLLQSTLYQWYSRFHDLPRLHGAYRPAFTTAAETTSNAAFQPLDPVLEDVLSHLPTRHLVEIQWWRSTLADTPDPPADIGYLFEQLIPAGVRERHGQFLSPPHCSAIVRALALRDADSVLDAGMGAGSLSIPTERAESVRVYGVEQSPTGFLMAVTALALTDHSGVVQAADFFKVAPDDLGCRPDARLDPDHRDTSGEVGVASVDAVVANPPFLANRDLPRERAHYRRHLTVFGEGEATPYASGAKQLSGRSNLCVYFLTHATRFLDAGGRLVIVLPTKVLDTQYGATLLTFLCDHYQLQALLTFEDDAFPDVQVNTVVVVADRCQDPTARADTITRFVTVSHDVAPEHVVQLCSASEPDVAPEEMLHSSSGPGYRLVGVPQAELAAADPFDGPPSQYFHMPPALQQLKQNEVLVPFNELAEVTYGTKTGHNELFLLDADDVAEWEVADRFLRPALDTFTTDPADFSAIADPDTYLLDMHAYVQACHAADQPDQVTAEEVLQALRRDGYHGVYGYLDHWRTTTSAELPATDGIWFDLGPLATPEIIHPYRIHRDVQVNQNPDDVVPTNCANGITLTEDVDSAALLGYLHSSVHAVFLEVWGQSEGGGSLEITTGTLSKLPVVDLRTLADEDLAAIKTSYESLRNDEADAQQALDEAVLTAMNASLDVPTLQDLLTTMRQDRLDTA